MAPDRPAQRAELVRGHEHVMTRPDDASMVRCIVRGCEFSQHRPWPGFCQACGASLIPKDAIYCRTCGASDYDE